MYMRGSHGADVLLWIALFAASSLFWAWIVFSDGAERLERSFLAGLIYWRAPEWRAEAIRLAAAGTWLCQTVWFIVGLLSPTVRTVGF